jgi:hypothetical protein
MGGGQAGAHDGAQAVAQRLRQQPVNDTKETTAIAAITRAFICN